MNNARFAENLSDLIFDKGITQKQLAESTGLDAASICKYLEANRMPTVDAIIKLADYFNCSVDFLLGVNEEKSNSKFLPCPPFSERLEYFLSVYGHSGHKLCKEAGLPVFIIGKTARMRLPWKAWKNLQFSLNAR